MKKFTLLDYDIFNDISGEELETLLPCINAALKLYSEGDDLTPLAKSDGYCCLILSGSVSAVRADGEAVSLKENQVFGVEMWAKELESGFVSFKAESYVTLLVMDARGVMAPCWFSCFFHHKLVENIGNACRNYGAYFNK